MPKKTEDPKSYYVPFQRFEEVQFVEEGMEDEVPFTAKLRTNLTFAEVEALTWGMEDDVRKTVWPMFAPYVVDWNIKGMGSDGELVDIPPPAERGGEQFAFIPIPLFWQIAREVKLRNMGVIDPKRKSRPGSMAETSVDES